MLPTEDWFIGLIEGEGCFSHGTDHGHYTPTFNVTQKERQVCDLLVEFFGFGSTSPNHDGTCYAYCVQHYKNCRSVAQFLLGRLILDKKREQFGAWCVQFNLLDDSKFRSDGTKIAGKAVSTPVQKWMSEHPEEVARIVSKH